MGKIYIGTLEDGTMNGRGSQQFQIKKQWAAG